jgi:hypothetical protein
VKRLLLCLALSGCGGGVADGWRQVTHFPRATFTNPGDAVTLAPTADTGPYNADPLPDCSTCPPR